MGVLPWLCAAIILANVVFLVSFLASRGAGAGGDHMFELTGTADYDAGARRLSVAVQHTVVYALAGSSATEYPARTFLRLLQRVESPNAAVRLGARTYMATIAHASYDDSEDAERLLLTLTADDGARLPQDSLSGAALHATIDSVRVVPCTVRQQCAYWGGQECQFDTYHDTGSSTPWLSSLGWTEGILTQSVPQCEGYACSSGGANCGYLLPGAQRKNWVCDSDTWMWQQAQTLNFDPVIVDACSGYACDTHYEGSLCLPGSAGADGQVWWCHNGAWRRKHERYAQAVGGACDAEFTATTAWDEAGAPALLCLRTEDEAGTNVLRWHLLAGRSDADPTACGACEASTVGRVCRDPAAQGVGRYSVCMATERERVVLGASFTQSEHYWVQYNSGVCA